MVQSTFKQHSQCPGQQQVIIYHTQYADELKDAQRGIKSHPFQ